MKAFFTFILGIFAFYFIVNLIANTDILYLLIQIAVYGFAIIVILYTLYYIGLGVLMFIMFIMDMCHIPCSKKLKSNIPINKPINKPINNKAKFNNKYNPFSKN